MEWAAVGVREEVLMTGFPWNLIRRRSSIASGSADERSQVSIFGAMFWFLHGDAWIVRRGRAFAAGLQSASWPFSC